jgi:hypothetical protein
MLFFLNPRSVNCTRWAELGDALRFHAGLATAANALTEFRLLNGAPPLVVGRIGEGQESYNILTALLDRPPGSSINR